MPYLFQQLKSPELSENQSQRGPKVAEPVVAERISTQQNTQGPDKKDFYLQCFEMSMRLIDEKLQQRQPAAAGADLAHRETERKLIEKTVREFNHITGGWVTNKIFIPCSEIKQ